MPQDKNITPMKYSKIKGYENKKAYQHVRPYLPEIKLIAEMNQSGSDTIKKMLIEGHYSGKRVKGMGQAFCVSFILNESFRVKPLARQLTLVMRNSMDNTVSFVNES